MTKTAKLTSILGIGLVLTLTAVDAAEARRGGSFGSRGSRTYMAPRTTNTSPSQTAPVQRSMTPQQKAQTPANAQAAAPAGAAAAAAQPARRGFLGGMGGGLLGGLLAGGLIGALLGHGFGGLGAGMMNTLIQVAIVAGIAFLVMAILRRRKSSPAMAGAGANGGSMFANNISPFPGQREAAVPPSMFTGGAAAAAPMSAAPAYEPAVPAAPETTEIGLVQADRDAFERLLSEVQTAFGREDYGALRSITTPEIMSYLSEEMSQNAVQGRRNEVTQTKLLQADIAEAWNEGDADYATAAMRYESIDIMRDRQSGAVVEGDPNTPTQTTELWTFVRTAGQPWKLSAIQEA